jgi:phosphate acyltransferase
MGFARLALQVLNEKDVPWEEVSPALVQRLIEVATPLVPDNTGGAMLLGVKGVCVISHGSSSANAIVNAVRVARDCVQADVVARLHKAMSEHAG